MYSDDNFYQISKLNKKVAELEQLLSYVEELTHMQADILATLLKGTPLLDKAFYGAPNPTPRHVLHSEFGIKFPDDTEANSR